MSEASVLVVEDDEDLRHLVAEVLTGDGLTVRTAADGHAALAEIAVHGMPALILLDMRMPRMNGQEFASALVQQYPARARLIVLTAAADPRRIAEQVNAFDWLPKPFEVEQLLAAVHRALPSSTASA
jgi:CheY-like chemotaxis protein